jgi:hypothetical protein
VVAAVLESCFMAAFRRACAASSSASTPRIWGVSTNQRPWQNCRLVIGREGEILWPDLPVPLRPEVRVGGDVALQGLYVEQQLPDGAIVVPADGGHSQALPWRQSGPPGPLHARQPGEIVVEALGVGPLPGQSLGWGAGQGRKGKCRAG